MTSCEQRDFTPSHNVMGSTLSLFSVSFLFCFMVHSAVLQKLICRKMNLIFVFDSVKEDSMLRTIVDAFNEVSKLAIAHGAIQL